MTYATSHGRRGGIGQMNMIRWMEEVGLRALDHSAEYGPRPSIPYTVRDLCADSVAAAGWQSYQAALYPRAEWSRVVEDVTSERINRDYAPTPGRPPLEPIDAVSPRCADCGCELPSDPMHKRTRCFACVKEHQRAYQRQNNELRRERASRARAGTDRAGGKALDREEPRGDVAPRQVRRGRVLAREEDRDAAPHRARSLGDRGRDDGLEVQGEQQSRAPYRAGTDPSPSAPVGRPRPSAPAPSVDAPFDPDAMRDRP